MILYDHKFMEDFMLFKDYFLSLTKQSRKEYAKRAGTTEQYISGHLINCYKTPRRKLLIRLADASNGAITFDELVTFFFKN